MNQSPKQSLDNTLAVLGLVLALPAVYFFTGSFLKYEMNLLPNVEIFAPSPAIMIGGLLVTIILNLFSLCRIKPTNEQETSLVEKLKSKTLNTIVAGMGLLFLTLLLGYVLLENLAESITVSMYGENYPHT